MRLPWFFVGNFGENGKVFSQHVCTVRPCLRVLAMCKAGPGGRRRPIREFRADVEGPGVEARVSVGQSGNLGPTSWARALRARVSVGQSGNLGPTPAIYVCVCV